MTQPGEFYQRDRGLHPPALTPGYKTSVARSPRYSLISLQSSVSEITGPVFGHDDIEPGDNDLLTNYAKAGESPIGVLGQIEGGVVMGIGTALTEAYRIEDGIPLTRRWRDYEIPRIAQAPPIDAHIVEHPTAEGPYGAKGIGELPSIPVAPAICNAIYAATGHRVNRLPVDINPISTRDKHQAT